MRNRLILAAAVFAIAALVAVPLSAGATLYKWIDDQGVVNYGDAPPGGPKNATPVDTAASSLSVFPGMTKEELARARESDTQYRMQQLERENAELRARAYAAAPPPPPAYDSQVAYAPDYYLPLVYARRVPQQRQLQHFPPHGRPVQKTHPFRGMTAEH